MTQQCKFILYRVEFKLPCGIYTAKQCITKFNVDLQGATRMPSVKYVHAKDYSTSNNSSRCKALLKPASPP